MPLIFVLVYRKDAMFALSIGEYVITVQIFLTLCQGQTVKNREHSIIKVYVSLINCTYLCIGSLWRKNTYNVRNNQYSVGFGCWNENICKIHKTQQQEEPAILDVINKIALKKIINEMPPNFVLVYREDSMFARSIGEYVITVQMFLTLCQGKTVINREHNIIKLDVSSIKCTYLCIG